MSHKYSYIHKILPGYYDLLLLQESNPEYFPFLLESSARETGSQEGFDILFASPQQQLVKYAQNGVRLNGVLTAKNSFLEVLDTVWMEENTSKQQKLTGLPFCGGWFVYLGYELASEIEPTVDFAYPATDEILAFAVRIPAAIIYDHASNQTHLVVEEEFADELDAIKSTLSGARHRSASENILIKDLVEEGADRYLDAVVKIIDYIREGDVFQVNLSRLWQAKLLNGTMDVDVYRQLRKANPAPFSGLIKFAGKSIISSSPERLFCTREGKIQTRPIAGTRPRGSSSSDDMKLLEELISNHKERAEHIMLIDLERNDLGRICRPGSINVDEFMVLESYAHVHHIVSNVSGKLLEDMTPGKIIRAVFPGGTITGCPKVRCMEIISELEQMPRGAYTGSLGYLNHDGDMDMNILIRSLEVRGNQVAFRAGAGIVADSSPEREVEETRAKAKGLIQALLGEST